MGVFYAMSSRLRPIEKLKRITKLVSDFHTLSVLSLIEFFHAPNAKYGWRYHDGPAKDALPLGQREAALYPMVRTAQFGIVFSLLLP